MNITKTKRIIALILAILWMGVIFFYSNQPSEESTASSMSASYKIVQTTSRFFGFDLQELEILEIASGIENTVRKIAHMVEYAILAFLWEKALPVIKKYHDLYVTLAICIVYAASDEIHQRFIPGRSGCIRDVLIDTSGALIMVLIFALIRLLKTKKMSEKQATD